MIDIILITIFLIIIVHNNIRIFYLARQDNYNNKEYFLESNKSNPIKYLNIAILILIFFYKTFKYRQVAIVLAYMDFFLRDFYIQYKYSQQTKKTGQLIPYAIVIIFFTILLIVDFFKSNS